MGRKHGIFSIGDDVFEQSPIKTNEKKDLMKISNALTIVFQQMRINGNRERTIDSYNYIFNQYKEHNKLIYVEDIDTDSIYSYLGSLEVSEQTKLIRLKSLKAVLSRFFNNGWLKIKFWSNIHIKIDKKVKKSAKESDIEVLISLLDKSTFIGFRDMVAILTLYRTGIRIATLGGLKERHIDFENKFLVLDGSIMKNHESLKLPIDDELTKLLQTLIKQNNLIREHYNTSNSNVFITQNGLTAIDSKSKTNVISKQLSKYSRRYGLKNINAHAIRRAYATQLLNKGASVALISKALGHSDLAVTTQYLDLDVEEVANNLREYL